MQPVRIVDILQRPTLGVVQGSAELGAGWESTKVVCSGANVPVYLARNMTGGGGHTLRLLGGLPFFNLLDDFAYNTFKISPFGNLLKLSSQFRVEIEPYHLFFKRSTPFRVFFRLDSPLKRGF